MRHGGGCCSLHGCEEVHAEKRGKVGSVASREGRREIDGELGLLLLLRRRRLPRGDDGTLRRPTTGDDGAGDTLLLLRPGQL
eukprot:scaffold20057_cov61-Phaeocystis_antarctica.AAC.4